MVVSGRCGETLRAIKSHSCVTDERKPDTHSPLRSVFSLHQRPSKISASLNAKRAIIFTASR